MSQEYKVVIERDLSEEVRIEIDKAIRSAVLSKVAELDFADDLSVSRIAGGIGSGGTVGMFLK